MGDLDEIIKALERESKDYIEPKKQTKTKASIPKPQVSSSKKVDDFEVFINHVKLNSNATTIQKIYKNTEYIKDILDKKYNLPVFDKPLLKQDEVQIIVSDPQAPESKDNIPLEEVIEYIKKTKKITWINEYSKNIKIEKISLTPESEEIVNDDIELSADQQTMFDELLDE